MLVSVNVVALPAGVPTVYQVALSVERCSTADDSTEPTKRPAIEAETCDACKHYLKIMHMAREVHAEPVADDLATLTLDLLVSEEGYIRSGSNMLLLFGDPNAEPGPS